MHRSWSHAAPSSRQERIISFIGGPGGGENMVNILPVLFTILGKATSNPHQRDANELAEFTPFPHPSSSPRPRDDVARSGRNVADGVVAGRVAGKQVKPLRS